jgi:hypothetical protein
MRGGKGPLGASARKPLSGVGTRGTIGVVGSWWGLGGRWSRRASTPQALLRGPPAGRSSRWAHVCKRVRFGGGSAAGPMVSGRSAKRPIGGGSGRVDSIRRSRRGRGEPAGLFAARSGRVGEAGGGREVLMSGCHWLCQCRSDREHWQSQWHPASRRARRPQGSAARAGRSAPSCRPQLGDRLDAPRPRRDLRECGVMTS